MTLKLFHSLPTPAPGQDLTLLMARRNLTNHSLRLPQELRMARPPPPVAPPAISMPHARHLSDTSLPQTPPPLGHLSATPPPSAPPAAAPRCQTSTLLTAPRLAPAPSPLKHLPPRCCSRRAAKLGGLVRVAGRARGVDPVRRGRPLGRRRHRGLVD